MTGPTKDDSHTLQVCDEIVELSMFFRFYSTFFVICKQSLHQQCTTRQNTTQNEEDEIPHLG